MHSNSSAQPPTQDHHREQVPLATFLSAVTEYAAAPEANVTLQQDLSLDLAKCVVFGDDGTATVPVGVSILQQLSPGPGALLCCDEAGAGAHKALDAQQHHAGWVASTCRKCALLLQGLHTPTSNHHTPV